MKELASPPLLEMFLHYRPGDIHHVAAKAHLLAGFDACKVNSVAGTLWNDDQTALTVSFVGGARTTLLAQGADLITRCSCGKWQPARNCPHVVVVWATLKRLVSPDALSHLRFDQHLLAKVKAPTDREVPSGWINPAHEIPGKPIPKSLAPGAEQAPGEQRAPEAPSCGPETAPRFCLLIAADHQGGGLSGHVVRGKETVTGWTTGIPTELSLFLLLNYSYDSTPRYFETFLKVTGDKHPIVFRDAQGNDTALSYSGDAPRNIGVAFEVRKDEVIVSRTIDTGQVPPGAVMHGKLLFDPEGGVIHPLVNSGVWKDFDEVIGQLDSTLFAERPHGCGKLEAGGAVPAEVASQDAPRLLHQVAMPLSVFNGAGVRLAAERLDAAGRYFSFSLEGAPVGPERVLPSYLLDLPDGIAHPVVTLSPLGACDGRTFALSDEPFWPVNPACRSRFGDSVGEHKRVRALLEAAFLLMDEETSAGRDAVISEVAFSPDFHRPEMKKDAKRLLTRLHGEWRRETHLLLATPDGWRLVQENHTSQARLLRILYETFGLKGFRGNVNVPGWLGMERELFSSALPRLLSRLQQEGFSLRVGSEPLVQGSWEFSLDAGSSGLDWFELHPEVRCDGEELSGEELRSLLGGGVLVPKMLQRDGRLILMDEASQRVLTMLAEALPSGKRCEEGEREPVRVPRLQILDWLELRKHGVTVKLAPGDARVLESLLDFRAIPERPLPAGLQATLRHYQADAYRWLAFLYEHRFGACLADDMGLGKTLQGITLLAGIMRGDIASAAPVGTPHLVVAPPSLLFNWEAELTRFYPEARVLLYAGTGRSIDTFKEFDIIVTSYGIVQRDIDRIECLSFDVIIFDETQVVKNLRAATSNAVRRLRGAFTLALTGTPVENRLTEYYAIMDLCLPGLLGSPDEFNRQISQAGSQGAQRLIRRTRPFVLRRTKQLIADELPPKIEMDIHLELLPKQKALYQRTVEEVRGQVREAYAGSAPTQARIIALTALLRLRQICLAPALAAAGAGVASPKLDFLAEQLLELRDEGHSALVFSQFTSYLDLVQEGLKSHGLSCLRLDGSTPVPRRKELVEAFQNAEEPSVFLISLKAGGRGLNLTKASYVYHMDPWWNPAVENQASDRAHRIGQTGQVTVTRLVMRHTIEEKMMELKNRKLELYRAILEEGRDAGGAGLTREDFEYLLG